MLYIKACISDGVKIVRNPHDSVIWLKLDRNVFNIESDIYIAGVYIWNENSPAYNLIDISIYYKMIIAILIARKAYFMGDWKRFKD